MELDCNIVYLFENCFWGLSTPLLKFLHTLLSCDILPSIHLSMVYSFFSFTNGFKSCKLIKMSAVSLTLKWNAMNPIIKSQVQRKTLNVINFQLPIQKRHWLLLSFCLSDPKWWHKAASGKQLYNCLVIGSVFKVMQDLNWPVLY